MKKLITDFHFDINDLHGAWDKGKITDAMALGKIANLCFYFLRTVVSNAIEKEKTMRIHNINPTHFNQEDREAFYEGKIVPFCGGKIRMAKEEEIKLMESKFNQKLERADGFIPAVFVD